MNPIDPNRCRQCGELWRTHLWDDVKRHLTTMCPVPFRMLEAGWRPYPRGNSLPDFIPKREVISAVPYEGEPRERADLRAEPEPQEWVPFWVDLIVELWARWIGEDAATPYQANERRAQRDALLRKVMGKPDLALAVEASWRCDGMHGMRDFIKPHVEGLPPPRWHSPKTIGDGSS